MAREDLVLAPFCLGGVLLGGIVFFSIWVHGMPLAEKLGLALRMVGGVTLTQTGLFMIALALGSACLLGAILLHDHFAFGRTFARENNIR